MGGRSGRELGWGRRWQSHRTPKVLGGMVGPEVYWLRSFAAFQGDNAMGFGAGLLEAADGVGFVGLDVEDGEEAGDLQDVVNAFGEMQQL
jgi:hypothetical protein